MMNQALFNNPRDVPGKRTPFKFVDGVKFLLDENDFPSSWEAVHTATCMQSFRMEN